MYQYLLQLSSREKSKIEICNFDRHTTSGQQRHMFLWGGTNQKKLYIYIFGIFSTFELFVCFSLFQNNAFSDSLGTIKYYFFCIHLYMKSTLAQTPESNVEGLWLFLNCFFYQNNKGLRPIHGENTWDGVTVEKAEKNKTKHWLTGW